MAVIQNKEALKAYIKEQCRSKLNSAVNDIEIDIAIKRQIVLQAAEWKQLKNDVVKANFDPSEVVEPGSARATELEALRGRLDTFGAGIVAKVNKDRNTPASERSTPERLINDYFSPAVYHAQRSSADLLRKIKQKLLDDPDSVELQQYMTILSDHVAYLDAVATLPFALEKLFSGLRENTGQNYTPKQNAQVVASLLETLQKSQEGQWTVEKLHPVMKMVTKVTMPDLPVDSFTLEKIEELLPCVNQIIDKSKALEQQKAALFPEDNPDQTNARKALLDSMGIEFVSLATICQDTLRKPVEDALQALQTTRSSIKSTSLIATEAGIDYLHTLNTLDQVGNVISGMPQELLPTSLQQFSGYYHTVKGAIGQAASVIGQVAGGTAQVLNAIGTTALHYTPNSVKTAADTAVNTGVSAVRTIAPTMQKVAATVGYLMPYDYIPYVPKQTFFSITDRVLGIASSFVPAYIKDKFKQPDPETLFWQSLKTSSGRDPHIAEAYFYFHDLSASSNSPALEEEFFQSIMEKIGITANYSDYLAFKKTVNLETLQTPLKEQLQLFEEAKSEEQFKILYMLQRIKTLENQIKQSKDASPRLSELKEALELQTQTPKAADFQKLFLRPALEKSLLYHEQRQFIPLLEKALDSGNNQLRGIYSKLKGGQLLSNNDLSALKNFSKPDISFSIDPNIEVIARAYAPPQSKEVANALTPKEESRRRVQATLDYIYPICSHISESFKKQLESCEGLRALCPNDPLKSSCDSKIKYLQKLQQGLTKLMEDIKSDDKLAEQIRLIISGEKTADLLAMVDAKTMSSQLMSGAWETLLPRSGMVTAAMPEKILAHALSSSDHLQGIVEAKHNFDKIIQDSPPPIELMAQLGNPFREAGVNESLLHKTIANAIESSKSYITALTSTYLTSTALVFVFPEALITNIAVDVLTRPSVKQQIGGYLEPIINTFKESTDQISGFISKQQEKLVDPIKNLVCPMLNIEVQKVLEQKAYNYVATDPANRSNLIQNERDAFSGFYLQYRALKKNNPALDKTACIEHLFRLSLAVDAPETRNKMVKEFRQEFERLDKVLKSKEAAASTQESELEEELQFLMSTVDFNSPDETSMVTMTIYNRLVMMQFEASKQLSEEEAKKVQQKAMTTIELVLKSLEKADANDKNADVRVHTRAKQFLPATKLAAKVKLNELQRELSATGKLIEGHIKDREEQLKADLKENEPQRLGKTVLEAEVAKSTKINLAAKIIGGLAKLAPPAVFWSTVGLTIASKGVLTGVLVGLGVAGGAAATVATGGLVLVVGFGVLAVIAAIKVAYNTVREVRAHDDEFLAIKESNASPIKKFGLTVLTGLKCFGIGLAKGILMDTVYDKIVSIFNRGVKPLVETAQNVRDLARSHPERNTIETENQSLSELQGKLKEFQGLIEEQIKDKKAVNYDPAQPDASKFNRQSSYDAHLKTYKSIEKRAEKIEAMSKDLAQALEDTQKLLTTSSSGDARWRQGVNQELEGYQKAFSKLTDLITQVTIIKNLERKMQPQMLVHEKIAITHIKQAQQQLAQAAKAAETLQGEQGQVLLRALKAKPSAAAMEEMAIGLRNTVAVITDAASQTGEHYRHADQATRDSGEVGFFSSIAGPTRKPCNEAHQAWQATEKLKKYAEEFVGTVEKEIAKQKNIEAAILQQTQIASQVKNLEKDDSDTYETDSEDFYEFEDNGFNDDDAEVYFDAVQEFENEPQPKTQVYKKELAEIKNSQKKDQEEEQETRKIL